MDEQSHGGFGAESFPEAAGALILRTEDMRQDCK